MIKKIKNVSTMLGISLLLLANTACGSIEIGIMTSTPAENVQQAVEHQETNSEMVNFEQAKNQTQNEPTFMPTEEISEPTNAIVVTAWPGHIVSLPGESQFDDYAIISPEGTGEFGLAGATPEIEAEIHTLGSNEFVYLWGKLSCNVPDYNGCQLLVNKMQYGANYSEENITDWVGTIIGNTFNGGPSYVFQLSGEHPVWYGIYASQDEAIQAQLENLRDTGIVVKVSGQLLVGVPDANGLRIEATNIEEMIDTLEQPTSAAFVPTAGWSTFVNAHYGYQIKYPPGANISFFGPVRFSPDDVPTDMTEDQYMEQLTKLYTDHLCIQIEYALGYIYISAPPNNEKDFMVPCGDLALGAGEIIAKNEDVSIGTHLSQASGHEYVAGTPTVDETLDLHNEAFWIYLDDGTRITYGATPRTDATYGDYQMKSKEVLYQILATYERLP